MLPRPPPPPVCCTLHDQILFILEPQWSGLALDGEKAAAGEFPTSKPSSVPDLKTLSETVENVVMFIHNPQTDSYM